MDRSKEKFDTIEIDDLTPIIEKCECIISELSIDYSEKNIYYKIRNTLTILVELIKKREKMERQNKCELKGKEFHEIKITEDNAKRYQTIWVKKCWQFHNLMVELNEITSEKFLPEGVFNKVSPSSSGHI
jgi:hypothetical protein